MRVLGVKGVSISAKGCSRLLRGIDSERGVGRACRVVEAQPVNMELHSDRTCRRHLSSTKASTRK